MASLQMAGDAATGGVYRLTRFSFADSERRKSRKLRAPVSPDPFSCPRKFGGPGKRDESVLSYAFFPKTDAAGGWSVGRARTENGLVYATTKIPGIERPHEFVERLK